MPTGRLSIVVDYLRRLAKPAGTCELSDALLLERFARQRDEDARCHWRLVRQWLAVSHPTFSGDWF